MMGPLLSWGCMVALAIGAWWYYYRRHEVNKAKAKSSSSVGRKRRTDSIPKREVKKSKTKDDPSKLPSVSADDVPSDPPNGPPNGTSLTVAGKKKKQKNSENEDQNALLNTSLPSKDVYIKDPVSEGKTESLEDEEFAKRLSSLKTGTSLTPTAQKGLNKKARRANKAALGETGGPSSSHDLSTNSSTTGADADDDLSPVGSPEFSARSNDGLVVEGGDVSDMLETPTPGPAVIRLTGSMEPPRQKPAPQKPFQVQESKKQRYARQKNEARKAEREEAEKQRRVLLEKQLRTAREAENRPPRNGTARVASKEPANNVWKPRAETSVKDGGIVGGAVSTPQMVVDQTASLLDTFDEQKLKSKANDSMSGNEPHVKENVNREVPATDEYPHAHPAPPVSSWADDLPSEEDQMRMIKDMNGDDGWSTVGKKKAKKISTSNPAAGGTSNENSDAGDMIGTNQAKAPAVTPKETESANREAGWKTNGSTHKTHPLDSDWAVA